jgi:hypothetical protein
MTTWPSLSRQPGTYSSSLLTTFKRKYWALPAHQSLKRLIEVAIGLSSGRFTPWEEHRIHNRQDSSGPGRSGRDGDKPYRQSDTGRRSHGQSLYRLDNDACGRCYEDKADRSVQKQYLSAFISELQLFHQRLLQGRLVSVQIDQQRVSWPEHKWCSVLLFMNRGFNVLVNTWTSFDSCSMAHVTVTCGFSSIW